MNQTRNAKVLSQNNLFITEERIEKRGREGLDSRVWGRWSVRRGAFGVPAKPQAGGREESRRRGDDSAFARTPIRIPFRVRPNAILGLWWTDLPR